MLPGAGGAAGVLPGCCRVLPGGARHVRMCRHSDPVPTRQRPRERERDGATVTPIRLRIDYVGCSTGKTRVCGPITRPRLAYSLPVIGPCNYRPVITAVITVITALCFPITCNWSFAERFRASPPCVLTPDDVKEAVAKKMKSKRTKQYT